MDAVEELLTTTISKLDPSYQNIRFHKYNYYEVFKYFGTDKPDFRYRTGSSQVIHRNPLFLEDITDCIHTSKYIDKTENVMYVSIQSFDF